MKQDIVKPIPQDLEKSIMKPRPDISTPCAIVLTSQGIRDGDCPHVGVGKLRHALVN